MQRVDKTSDQKQVLEVIGLSKLVRDKEVRFIDEIEDKVEFAFPYIISHIANHIL